VRAQARHDPGGEERDHRVSRPDRGIQRDAARPEVGSADARAPAAGQEGKLGTDCGEIGSTDSAVGSDGGRERKTRRSRKNSRSRTSSRSRRSRPRSKRAALPKRSSSPRPKRSCRAGRARAAGPAVDLLRAAVRGKLQQQFAFKNPHQIPRLKKIVLNVGMVTRPRTPRGSRPRSPSWRPHHRAASGDDARERRRSRNFNLREGRRSAAP